MADLSTLVEYERLYPVEIKNPITGDSEGVTFYVVSTDSKRVVDALRKAQADYWGDLSKKKDGEAEPSLPDSERIILINCIDSWDWAGQSFGHISGSGKASLEDREFIVDHPNAKWVRDQVANGTARLENFSQASPKSARRGSKKT